MRFTAEEWDRWRPGPYLIVSRANGEVLGSTGFGFQTPDEAMTGYVLARSAWGNGFATEALSAIVELSPRIGIRRLFALCHPDHRPSRRVLEKCGFVREGGVKAKGGVPQSLAGCSATGTLLLSTFRWDKAPGLTPL